MGTAHSPREVCRPDARPRVLESLLWAIGLSAIWLVVYGACNWVSSLRTDVVIVQFDWEKRIPLIPWLIVPYMSIDLFFFAAPFLCRSRRELHVLATRLLAATVIAAFFFLAMPMTLAESRPQFEGWAGAIHDVLKAGDRPFNLFPSLHATLVLLLWPVYAGRSRGVLRAMVHVWFGLVLVSILPVYQHHFIDLVGGVCLAWLCVAAFPARAASPEVSRSRGTFYVGLAYTVGAAISAALGVWLGPWGVIPGWLALSLALVGHAYLLGGPELFGKQNGRLPPRTRVLLAPYLAGLWLSRRVYAWRGVGDAEQFGSVIVGRCVGEVEARTLLGRGVVAVLDLTAEHSEARAFRTGVYLNVPVLDLTRPTPAQRDLSLAFIREHTPRGLVYVHCGLGVSRSREILRAYLGGAPASAVVGSTAASPHAGRMPRCMA